MNQLIGWATYKNRWTLEFNEDYFYQVEQYGCSEYTFAEWLVQESFLKRRFEAPIKLSDIKLSESRWRLLEAQFVRHYKKSCLLRKYPRGYFEAINKDGYVACLLPSMSGNAGYRVCIYNDNGPISHHDYSTRDEALEHMASQQYSSKPGALDLLVGTDKWNRGLWICLWLSEQLSPWEGLKRDCHIEEVQSLFQEAKIHLDLVESAA